MHIRLTGTLGCSRSVLVWNTQQDPDHAYLTRISLRE